MPKRYVYHLTNRYELITIHSIPGKSLCFCNFSCSLFSFWDSVRIFRRFDSSTLSHNGVVKFKMDGVDWISGAKLRPSRNLLYEVGIHNSDGIPFGFIEALASNGCHFMLTILKTNPCLGPEYMKPIEDEK